MLGCGVTLISVDSCSGSVCCWLVLQQNLVFGLAAAFGFLSSSAWLVLVLLWRVGCVGVGGGGGGGVSVVVDVLSGAGVGGGGVVGGGSGGGGAAAVAVSDGDCLCGSGVSRWLLDGRSVIDVV